MNPLSVTIQPILCHQIVQPSSPFLSHLEIRPCCGTVSKILWKSRWMTSATQWAQKFSPTHPCLCVVMEYFTENWEEFYVQTCPHCTQLGTPLVCTTWGSLKRLVRRTCSQCKPKLSLGFWSHCRLHIQLVEIPLSSPFVFAMDKSAACQIPFPLDLSALCSKLFSLES